LFSSIAPDPTMFVVGVLVVPWWMRELRTPDPERRVNSAHDHVREVDPSQVTFEMPGKSLPSM